MGASAILLVLVLQASTPTPAAGRSDAASSRGEPKASKGSEIVCHPGPGTGRIAGPPMCHTRDEWEAMVRTATSGAAARGGPQACRPGMMTGC